MLPEFPGEEELMLAKLINNSSQYFVLGNRHAKYRVALSTTILSLTFAKAFILKSWADYYRDLPNDHLKNDQENGFYEAAFLSIAASGLWIFLDYVSARLRSHLSESLKSDMYADILDGLKKPKVALVLKSQHLKVAESLPQLLVVGLADYTTSLVDNTLGFVIQLVDFTSSAYNFSQKSDRTICAICFASSALMTAFSFYLTQGSREISSTKSECEHHARMDAQEIVDNNYQIASKGSETQEFGELKKSIRKLSVALSLKAAFDTRNNSLNWWMTDLSSRILSTAMAPLVFAKQISFQTEFFMLNRELYQVRAFVLWICALSTGNFCYLNDAVYNTRTAIEDCMSTIAGSKLKFDDHALLRINDLKLWTPDGSRQILDITKPVTLKPGVYLLTGNNGSGKSTLLNALSGLTFANVEGSISIAPDDQKVYVPQSVRHKNGISLLDLIVYPKTIREFAPRTPTMIRNEICEMLKYFQQDEFADDLDKIGDWEKKSGGQKQIFLLIQALILKPKVLFLDEVTSAMSEGTKRLAKSLIKKYAEDNAAVVIHIEHGGRNDGEFYTHKLSIEKQGLKVESLEEIEAKKHR